MEIGINAPPMHPNCVLPDTELIAPGIEAITKSDYSGDVIKFVTANGRNVTVTPNHIVPTSRGWIRAKNLVKGDKVFCYRGCIESRTIGTPTDNNRTPTIENLFASIIEAQSSTTCCVPAASIDLKGDVIPNSKINIIFVDGKLGDKINTLMSKFISDSFLIGTGETRESVLSRDGSLSKLLIRIGLAFDGFMGRFDKGSVFFRSSATSRDLISLRRASDYDARLFKYSVNNTATDFILIGNSQTTHAGSVISDNGSLINLSLSSVNRNSQRNSIFNENFFNSFSSLMDNSRYLSDTFTTLIEIDDIIDIQRCFYSGHVYDASSLSTLYIANGIVTSNCHCSTAPHSDRKEYEKWLDGLANGGHDLRFDEWKELEAKTNNSGALNGAWNNENDPNCKKRDEIAKALYAQITNRKKSYEIKQVAKNSGFTEEEVSNIYEHVFIRKHKFRSGEIKKFDPDYYMAHSWLRLRQGKDIQKHDITMLNHELAEEKEMQDSLDVIYEDSHERVQKIYNYQKELLEYLKDHDV